MKPGSYAAVLALALCASCGRNDSAWRTYREVVVEPGHNHDQAAMAMPADMPGGGGAAPTGSLAWKSPDGWTESPGTGMRLVSFAVGSGTDTGLCTIVMLGGDAGGVEANVVRWIGQIGATAPSGDALGAFMARQDKIASAGGFEGLAVDLTELDPSLPQSMLAALLDVDGSTAFIKLTGSPSLLKQEKQRFLEVCRSIKKP
jgi:hypothetical protein